MSEEPAAEVRMRDFGGLDMQTDEHDLPPGAADRQLNVTCEDSGQLKSRRGLQPVQFEGE